MAYREDVLSPRERRFLDNMRAGMDPRPAAQAAGWADPKTALWRLEHRPLVQQELGKIYAAARRKANITRDQVLQGFKDAIDDAKLAGDPATQIKGWTEIGKMCGFYAPEEKKVTVDIQATELAKQIDSLSTEELLRLAKQDSLEVIEAEFEIVREDEDASGEA